MDRLTLHADDYTVIGKAADAVDYIVVNPKAVQQRETALLLERIALSRKYENSVR
jgi:hypothetical protein